MTKRYIQKREDKRPESTEWLSDIRCNIAYSLNDEDEAPCPNCGWPKGEHPVKAATPLEPEETLLQKALKTAETYREYPLSSRNGFQAQQVELADEIVRLREEGRALIRAYVNTLEVGLERIVSLGGTCDPVDRMEAGDPALLRAKAAFKAHTVTKPSHDQTGAL